MLTLVLHLHGWRGCSLRRRFETVAATCGFATLAISRSSLFARTSGLDGPPAAIKPGVLIEMSAWRAGDDERPRVPKSRT